MGYNKNGYNKNKDLYGEIIRILSDSNGMKFGELNRELERSCEEKYEYKRLSNLLYRKVGKGELQRDEEGVYSIRGDKEDTEKNVDDLQPKEECFGQEEKGEKSRGESDMGAEKGAKIFEEYIDNMMGICKDKEKEIDQYVSQISFEEFVEIKKTLNLNEEIMLLLKKRKQDRKEKETA